MGINFSNFLNRGLVVFWNRGVSVLWNSGVSNLWNSGVSVLWNRGVSVLWSRGMAALWNRGSLVIRNEGLPVLSDKDLNRAKNKKAVDEVIPFVYETVIAWGCKKDKDEYFLAYYTRRAEKLWDDNKEEWEKEVEEKLKNRDMTKWPEANKEKEKKKITQLLKEEKENKLLIKETWTQEENNHLKKENCQGLDTTFLHKLVPTICDGIGRYNPNVPSRTNIEQFLREVKNKRNDICHDPKGASISDTILDDFEVSAINVFMAAGDLYAPALEQQTVQDKIDELKERLQMIKEEVMTDDQQRILQTAKKLSEDGMAEIKKVVQEQATNFLPFSDDKFTRKDVFHAVRMTIREEKQIKNDKSPDDQTSVEIPCTELLQHHDGDAILCEGVPGSGKTTFLRRLRDDFFDKEEKMFLGLDMFDLLLYMDCRDQSLESILQLLKRTFPRTMNQLNDQEALQALHERKLLICVDGLDELNKHSRKLFDELLRTFKMYGNATFLCTSRPGQSGFLRSVKYKTVTLLPITTDEEQITFLQRYQANIAGIEAPELIRAFETLDQSCKECLKQPIYLALLCLLYRKYGQKVCTWKNELEIMEHILSLSKQTMIDRMTGMDIENLDGYASDVTKAVSQLSVELISKNKLIIDEETYTALCRQIFSNANVVYYSILSSFFIKHSDGQSFEVFHYTFLEFLAARWLYITYESIPSASMISIILSRKLDLQTNLSNVVASSKAVADGKHVLLRRFENVLRFVCLMLYQGNSTSAMKRFLEEVCPALVQAGVGRPFFVELVLGCPDSDEVLRAAAKASQTVAKRWTVQSSRDMTGTSKMLRYCQPARLDIKPLRSEARRAALTTLLKAVAQWHTGELSLFMNDSHDNYSACNASIACLEAAQYQLYWFTGCLSGDSDKACRALVKGVKKAKRVPQLFISLLDPRQHELGQLDGTRHKLFLRVRPPSKPDDRRHRRPLPTSTKRPPVLRVEYQAAPGGGALADEESTAALIEDLAPTNMVYVSVFILHYPGTDDALDRTVARLMASGVRTPYSSTRGWKEAWSRDGDGQCWACGDSSSHRPEERCVELWLSRNPDAVEAALVSDTDQ